MTDPGFRGYELNIEYPGNGAEPERKGCDENHQGDEGEKADTVHLGSIFLFQLGNISRGEFTVACDTSRSGAMVVVEFAAPASSQS